MEDFCGSGEYFLNTSQVWTTHNPNISECFSRSVLTILPSIILLVSLIESVFLLKVNRRQETKSGIKSISYVITARVTLLWILLALKIATAAADILQKNDRVSTSDVIYVAISIISLLVNIFIQAVQYKTRSNSSGLQFFYWLSSALFYLPTLKRDIEDLILGSRLLLASISLCYQLLLTLLLATQWLHNWDSSIISENNVPYPLWLFFSWLSGTFSVGYRTGDKLSVDDLPEINKKISISKVQEIFKKYSLSIKKIVHSKTLTVLVKSFGGTFVVAGVLRAVNDVLLYMTPIVFRKIIQTIENDDQVWKGYFWCVVLFITATVQVIISNHYFRQAYVTAFQMRTAIISAIYRKTLTVANHSRQEFSSGEITNLMSIDAQRFMEIVPFLNTVWSGPFQFALAIYFLYDLIGPSALAGLAVFAILIPINIYGGKYGRRIQQEQMKAKDERILLMNEVLQGIKVLKVRKHHALISIYKYFYY